MSQKPKKARSVGPKKLNINSKAKWKKILKDVDKQEVPIHILEKLIVHLKDGTNVEIDIKNMLNEGADVEDLEERVNTRLSELERYIINVDFFVDIELVERTVQPETDKILSKL